MNACGSSPPPPPPPPPQKKKKNHHQQQTNKTTTKTPHKQTEKELRSVELCTCALVMVLTPLAYGSMLCDLSYLEDNQPLSTRWTVMVSEVYSVLDSWSPETWCCG